MINFGENSIAKIWNGEKAMGFSEKTYSNYRKHSFWYVFLSNSTICIMQTNHVVLFVSGVSLRVEKINLRESIKRFPCIKRD